MNLLEKHRVQITVAMEEFSLDDVTYSVSIRKVYVLYSITETSLKFNFLNISYKTRNV